MKVSVRSLVPLMACLALLLGGSASAPAIAAERHSKLDKVLQDSLGRDDRTQSVIVRTEPGSRDAVRRWLRFHGALIIAEHPSLDALTVKLRAHHLVALARNPNVVSLSSDAEVTSFTDLRLATATTTLLRATLGLESSGLTGVGVGVAIVDSGIEWNRDLQSSIRGFWDFTRGGVPSLAYDDYGHGTHLAGLIASDGTESKGQYGGLAPDANLFGLKVLDKYGRGRVSDVIKALEWILANHRAKGIHVVNLSLGHPIYQDAAHDPLVIAVQNLVRAGVIVVVAAGNAGMDANGQTGYAGITSPANAPSALTVGAADTKQTVGYGDDRVAYFSSRGPSWYDGYAKPDFVAPGVGLASNVAKFGQLFTAYPQLKIDTGNGNGTFGTLSGTSTAAAVATGVVALLVQASAAANPGEPRLAPNALKAILQYTAVPLNDDLGVRYDALTQGTGELNPLGALAMVSVLDTAAPVGSQWIAVRPTTVTSIAGLSYDWARSITWDDVLVTNPDAIWVHVARWDENIVWGTAECATAGCEAAEWGATFAENIVWGTSIAWAGDLVWSDRIVGTLVDSENIVWGTVGRLEENIVWGTYNGENIVWGTLNGENIVWGTFDGENIVWGTTSTDDGENLVWGSASFRDSGENVVWGSRLTARHHGSTR